MAGCATWTSCATSSPRSTTPSSAPEWRDIKHPNKVQLAQLIADRTSTSVDPDSLFDVQVKRIHEYKRQHLTALSIVALYHRLKSNPNLDVVPRTFVFGGKAAPGTTWRS